MTHGRWHPCEPLDPPRTWLLEASAGTGKTYQIASLVLRLVAELGIPIREILAITFTNAATAELRDRIRRRLHDARRRLVQPAHDDEDEVLAHLRAHGDRDRCLLRLELALRDFDLAPISTIHGFCERTLEELAFESGQDAQLELVTDPSAVRERLVDDALALLFANATASEVRLFEKTGFTRKVLLEVAAAMCSPSAPDAVPKPARDPLLDARAHFARAAAVHAQWSSAEGCAALAVLRSDAACVKGKRNLVSDWIDKIIGWLGAGAPPQVKTNATALARIRPDWLRANWCAKEGRPPSPEQRVWWPFVLELDALILASEEFHQQFAPPAWFAQTIRARYERELRHRHLLTFDGMVSRLADTLADERGAPLAERLRNRYRAVFVDEFQDTDAAQWTILRTAFFGHTHLFLIGDPKQAIYAFRGADVHVYLSAAHHVADAGHDDDDGLRTMGENWRSDPAAVEAMNHLWQPGSGAFATEGIDYVEVAAKRPRRLERAVPGLQVQWLDARAIGGDEGAQISKMMLRPPAALAAQHALEWLTGKHGGLLEGRRSTDDDAGQGRTPRPSDLAVLVHSHEQARSVRRALGRLGIPAVAAAQRSVFQTAAASWIGAWIDAVAAGGRDREARAAAVTPLWGWRHHELAWALEVAERGEPARAEAAQAGVVLANADAPAALSRDWNAWTKRLHAAAERYKTQGFARTLDRELSELGTWPRLLAGPEGERHATDLRHLFELLHVEERARRLGPAALAQWLRAQADATGDESLQRLESDANAVRVETVHVSKGLEYPIVLLPFAWHAKLDSGNDRGPITVHTDDGQVVDLHPTSHPDRQLAVSEERAERRREDTRKLYVALTRARHTTTAWWGPVGQASARTDGAPLGRLLMREAGATGFDGASVFDFKKDAATAFTEVTARLDALQERSRGTIAWAPAEQPARPQRWTEPNARTHAPTWPAERVLPTFSRRWTVTSYTSLAAEAAAVEHDEPLRRDVAAVGAASSPGAHDGGAEGREPSVGATALDKPPLQTFAAGERLSAGAGTVFGTFVHEALEAIDFETQGPRVADTAGTLRDVVAGVGARNGFEPSSHEVRDLTAMLPKLLATPLDAVGGAGTTLPLPSGFSLSSVAARDRLDELGFDLRLGRGTAYVRRGGDDHAAPGTSLRPMPGCVDPRRAYDALFAEPETAAVTRWLGLQRDRARNEQALVGSIAGILTGSIDLVFRVGDDADARYFLADYKTNRIEDARAGHYAGAWLDWEMAKTGYLLQSLLYTVALHRHLTLRLGPSGRYSYEQNFGGALYLFVRGMAGADTPRDPSTGRCLGVFAHRWSPHVVAALDEALASSEGEHA